MKKIGILGGTFDPIHKGHINLATDALIEKGLDFVFIMPAKRNPFKRNMDITDESHRINMIKLAISDLSYLCLLETEIKGQEISYTYDTLMGIRKDFFDCQIYFISGTDSLISMKNWYRGKELLESFSIIVGGRPGYKNELLDSVINENRQYYNADITLLKNSMYDISSTEIRNNIKNKQPICGLVPEKVERYIIDNGLYL